MKVRKILSPVLIAAALGGLMLVSGSCRQRRAGESGQVGFTTVVAPELTANTLGSLPGAVYHSQAGSPIHWQPWTKESLERAKAARRLVMCVIVMPQQPGFLKVLDALSANPSLVATINDQYVPVLVDGEAAREIGILTADLCAEIQRPLQLPLFVWMTHEGNPVAWIPVSPHDSANIQGLFQQSHSMIAQMWEDDAGLPPAEWASTYVLKNSAMDNTNRRHRFEQRASSKFTSEQPAEAAARSLRQLASLYDPYSRSFDEAGGLFPSSSIELLATASVHPGLPSEVRTRCMETTRALLDDLLASAMFDPLDGGVFSSRHGKSWSFPSFIRECPSQARVAVSLIAAFRATGERRALENALGVISFAENTYLTADGLFSIGLAAEPDLEKWMWSVEDVETALGREDAAWWIKATRMKGLGNLPSEVDPQREFFRENTLGLAKPLTMIAAELSQPIEVFAPRFEAVRAKLLATRNARLGKSTPDEQPHAGASFRMVSAYAAAFAATGDEAYRNKAVTLLERSREAFGQGARLRMFSEEAPDSIGAGRGFLYALALQAALDVAAITSDEQWLLWSEDLATTAAELFTGNGFLKECPDGAQIIDLPISDLVMLFDDSTAGLVSMAESRLAGLGRPLVASFSELATPLPTYVTMRPILHTDLILATLVRHYNITVVSGGSVSAELKAAISRLPVKSVQRRSALPLDEVPEGSVKVLLPGGASIIATTPDALQEALLPSHEG